MKCVMDFELPLHNAFTAVFESADISGYLFHFGQSCWCKICELGKKVQYNTDSSFALRGLAGLRRSKFRETSLFLKKIHTESCGI